MRRGAQMRAGSSLLRLRGRTCCYVFAHALQFVLADAVEDPDAERRATVGPLPSNLRLGVCTQNAEPYVHMSRNIDNEEVLYGFEIEVWQGSLTAAIDVLFSTALLVMAAWKMLVK